MENTIKNFAKPFENEPTAAKDNTLNKVLSWSQSSHDPVFVLDEEGKYLGAVSPHLTLFKKHLPYSTKVTKYLIHTPTITKETEITKAAQFMIDTRLYRLPLLNSKKEIAFTVSAQDLLEEIASDEETLDTIVKLLEIKKPITANIQAKVKDVFSNMRKMKISRFILVDDKGKIAGIVSKSDIKHSYLKPDLRERFSKTKPYPQDYSFDEEAVYRKDDPVCKFYTKNVSTEQEDRDLKEIILNLIFSGYTSIILKDKANRPTGFLSYRNILKAISAIPEG